MRTNNMNFDWNAVSNGAPYITVCETCIAINDFASNLIGNPQKVSVGFDKENNCIGIIPYDENKNIPSYSFSSRKKNGWIRIGCKDFIKYLTSLTGIPFIKSKRYTAKYNKEQNIIYIILDDQVHRRSKK